MIAAALERLKQSLRPGEYACTYGETVALYDVLTYDDELQVFQGRPKRRSYLFPSTEKGLFEFCKNKLPAPLKGREAALACGIERGQMRSVGNPDAA